MYDRTLRTTHAVTACCLATLAVAGAARAADLDAQAVPRSQFHQAVNDTFRLTASELVTLDVAPVPGEPMTVVIPVAGQSYTLDLFPQSVRGDDFKVYHAIGEGELIEVDPGPVRTLRGIVVEVPGSRVSGSLMDDGLHVSMRIPGVGHYWAQPIAPLMEGAPADEYVVYANDALISANRPCGTEHKQLDKEAVQALAADLPLGNGGAGNGDQPDEGGIAGGGQFCFFETELACDADFPYFQDWGASTEARIEAVINSMNDQYEDDVEITHVITAIIVRTSSGADPYSSNNAGTLLSQFRSWWLNNADDIERDVAHLFTGRNLNGSTIGIAFDIGAICTNNAYCLSQSDCCCCPSFACATDLSAHELGHLWNGFHCNCTSFTMNSFITCANQFSSGTQSSIIAHRNSRTCLVDSCFVVNDECFSPTPIVPGTTPYTNENATTDGPDEAICPGGTVESDVWFRWTATCNGTATVSLCNSNFDTVMAVYDVFCPGDPNQAIACNDDSCGTRSELTFPVDESGFYFIRVGGWQGAQGSGELEFTLECDPDPVCLGDINGDDEVDVDDLTALILAWDTADPDADLNGDGEVDVDDLTLMILAWGPCE